MLIEAMMNIYTVIQLLVIFVRLCRGETSCDGGYREPQCYSRFDYEYKVLQRLIQLEEAQRLNSHENDIVKQQLTQLEETQEGLTQTAMQQENEIQELKSVIKRLTDIINTTQTSGPLVAFTSYIDSTTTQSATTVFDKVLLNEQAAYDQTTGVFTCPKAGIYMVSFVIAGRGTSEVWAQLKVNGDVTLEAVAEGTSGSQDLQGNNIAIVKLNAGDRVWISGGGSLPGNSRGNSNTRTSSFSGVLLYPTTA